jgi:hypothetical protein
MKSKSSRDECFFMSIARSGKSISMAVLKSLSRRSFSSRFLIAEISALFVCKLSILDYEPCRTTFHTTQPKQCSSSMRCAPRSRNYIQRGVCITNAHTYFSAEFNPSSKSSFNCTLTGFQEPAVLTIVRKHLITTITFNIWTQMRYLGYI